MVRHTSGLPILTECFINPAHSAVSILCAAITNSRQCTHTVEPPVTETTQFYLQRKWAVPYVALRENTKRVTRELSAWMSPLGLPALYKDFFLNLYWALLCYTKPGSNNDLLRRRVVISSSRCVLFNKPCSRFKSASPVQGIRDISD